MNYQTSAQKIMALKKADVALRYQLVQNGQLGQGYHEAMQALHNQNARHLDDIIDTIGYPTIDNVGEEASEAAWLVIQHSIAQPNFMRKCAKLLKEAVAKKQVNPINLAYLTDRIAVFEGKPQLYGTQFDWDETGALSPNAFDDLTKVNQRRKSIGLNTLEDQTAKMRRRAEEENQCPPIDYEKRKREIEEWRKAVGWIK